MPDLVAQGTERSERWRRPIPAGRTVILGRGAGTWSVSWDNRISRRHAQLAWDEGALHVTRIEGAKNPVFWRGREDDSFTVGLGEHFVIGQTTFRVEEASIGLSQEVPAPRREHTFTGDYLRRIAFQQAGEKIDVLSRLPELVAGGSDDDELVTRLVSLLLSGIPHASAVALLECRGTANDTAAISVLCWDRRESMREGLRPSVRLVCEACASGQSVVHIWGDRAKDKDGEYTANSNMDWAFCTPISWGVGDCWAIYVVGSSDGTSSSRALVEGGGLHDELKFTEVAASTVVSLRRLRNLQRQQSSLRAFFSPSVLEALKDSEPAQALAPREADISVLFCDLRGFSRESEQSADDLFGVLDRVSRALGVATGAILQVGGVVGDFHGDAVMGFWGWPFPQPDAAVRACQAALAIQQELSNSSQQQGVPAAGFNMGMGIATGKAVAGRIGTADQAKITAFGPVVNLAARLEGMTKTLRVSILIDEATARFVCKSMPKEQARCRRLAVVQPIGFRSKLLVSELLPPESTLPWLTTAHLRSYERAVDHWLAGNWDEALQFLHQVPAADRAKDFLTVYIAQHNRVPPDNWDGCIHLTSK